MAKSIKKNYIFNLSYQIFAILTPIITAPYLARIFGADGVGVISYTEAVVSYFVLFANMGISIYGQREISYYRDDMDKRSIIFWNVQLLKFITTIVSLVLYGFFTAFVAQKSTRFLYSVLSIQIISVVTEVVWFFQGLEEFGKVVARNVIVKIIGLIYIFTAVNSSDDIALYLVGIVGIGLLSGVCLWGYLPKYIRKISFCDLKPFSDIKVVIALFIPTIAIQIYSVVDKTMIGIITQNSYQNGYYEQAIKIVRVALTVITALGPVVIPRIGYYFQNKMFDEMKSCVYRGYNFALFLAVPMCVGMVIIAEYFVPWFFGAGYEGATPILQVLSLLFIAIGINMVTGNQYMIPTKKERVYTFTVIVGACVNFFLNIFFIYYWRAMGAAIASVVAETVIAVLQLIIVRKELSIKKILHSGFNYFLAAIVMGIVLMFEKTMVSATTGGIVIMVAGGMITYIAVLLLVKDDFVISNTRLITKRIYKK